MFVLIGLVMNAALPNVAFAFSVYELQEFSMGYIAHEFIVDMDVCGEHKNGTEIVFMTGKFTGEDIINCG